jgi:hypothetical protein
VRIELQNSYQRAGRTEIVHIYSNMETRADYTFTPADFTDFIVFSGTVDIKIDGTRPDYAVVHAFKPEFYGREEQLGYSFVQWDATGSTGTWRIAILSSSSPRIVPSFVFLLYFGHGSAKNAHGIRDFEDIRTGAYVYADKTACIYRLAVVFTLTGQYAEGGLWRAAGRVDALVRVGAVFDPATRTLGVCRFALKMA